LELPLVLARPTGRARKQAGPHSSKTSRRLNLLMLDGILQLPHRRADVASAPTINGNSHSANNLWRRFRIGSGP